MIADITPDLIDEAIGYLSDPASKRPRYLRSDSRSGWC
jgi:hypothetical protein